MSNQKAQEETLAGLHALIRDLDLKIPVPVVKSVIPGTRKTRITDAEVIEQYPKSYQPTRTTVGLCPGGADETYYRRFQ
jgi:hypothetical protein